MACSAAIAAGVACAGVVDFDKLILKCEDEFSTPSTKVDTSGATYTDNKYTLEGELTDSTAALTVTPKVEKQKIEKFTLNFTVGFVEEIPAYNGAAVGFAFKATDKAAYWNGSAWTEITLTTPYYVEEDTAETVLVEYDGRATQAKVRFTIRGVQYGWYEVGTIGVNQVIKAFGSGVITAIAGTTHTVESAIIPVTPSDGDGKEVRIDFTSQQIADLEAAGVDFSDPTTLNTPQNNGQTKLTNYILFGTAEDSEITSAVLPKAVGVPIALKANNVAVKVSGLNVQPVEGTQVKYVLMGSEDNTDFTPIGDPQDSATFEFSNTTDDRYFKVQAVIHYTTPANDSTSTDNH